MCYLFLLLFILLVSIDKKISLFLFSFSFIISSLARFCLSFRDFVYVNIFLEKKSFLFSCNFCFSFFHIHNKSCWKKKSLKKKKKKKTRTISKFHQTTTHLEKLFSFIKEVFSFHYCIKKQTKQTNKPLNYL